MLEWLKELFGYRVPMLDVHVVASNQHDDLWLQLNAWMARVRPRKIHHIALAADGADFTYVVMIVFS